MKLLMIFVPSDCLDKCQAVLEREGVHAYTEIPRVLGSGSSGLKMGTRAFPGTSSLILVALEDAAAKGLVDAMERDCEAGASREETRVFAVPVERLL